MNKPDQITFFETVADLYNALEIPIAQDCEFSMNNLLSIHKEIPYKSPIFRTNYYSFLFITDGSGNYTTDDQKFEYEAKTIYFTNPGHIKAFEFYELREAYLITFSEAFLETHLHQNIFTEFPFLLSETVPPQKPSDQEYKEIETLYLQIFEEYKGSSAYKNKIISNLLVVLLLKIKALFWQNYLPLEEGNTQSIIVQKFKENLEDHYRNWVKHHTFSQFQPQDYAKLQNLNASYFSQVIKSKTGKSPSQWIAEKTISMAKSLLVNSSKSIKEISFAIGFLEIAHFSNFFKKQTGFSPSLYRQRHKI